MAVASELVDGKTIKEGRYDVIEERARQFLAVIAKARAEMKAWPRASPFIDVEEPGGWRA